MLSLKQQSHRALSLASKALVTRFASIDVKVPSMGESITEGTIQTLKKKYGDSVKVDELIAVIETDKISVDVTSPAAGKLTSVKAKEGDTVYVGDVVFVINDDEPSDVVQGDNGAVMGCGPLLPDPDLASPVLDEEKRVEETHINWSARKEERVPLSRMRLRIAERLKEAQQGGVLLTTFQECDMSKVMKLRKKLGKQCLEEHGVKLGFNSFFITACAKALTKWSGINSVIEGTNLVKRNFVDISVAVATPTGLMVPVIRDADKKSLLTLESELAGLAKKARDGKLSLDEMAGGTFTISNGGIYGSLMGTPIINPPQSAILGMHSIQDRAVVRNGKVVVRPIMYLALTYDHRIVDGKEAVSFLKDVRDMIEDPAKILLETQ
eukprot:Blabericola_migrator_1__6196@NODE_3129_length_2016_cov_309_804002_g1959_i0_p1_GENE_NODE_3129_length_2016_cov_309_804002_g1959_i0NODE_3129_length_2016_cov_309_804002_g1959_i0_p1_ORF_typecomplete_len381_score94_702oxoacid_dh/PF00198_23/1_9e84Biotin_lipoyl/PF00364_22/1e19Biotin_lipoyl_2/PF13533_6/0_79Biotin_lipoyl_2/PF13533_6/6_7e06HlyD_D23/PF16576_5/2_7HlyD_D23/PF16576_5/0_00032RnfC_N/PF13375_6/0_0046HlyD_3/PF13437_6/1_1e03HlyD_3/PF13437_6/0_011HlyD_2/PF12700_7/39HlyD_2/PF12700_7/0_13HlyD_2/PF1270